MSRLLNPVELRRFENFHFAARMVVEGFHAGRHRSPFHDASAEFADYRSYVPGDDIRALDWRACARTDRDYLRLFRKESDLHAYLLLDTSRSMEFSGQEKRSSEAALTKLEYAAYLAAALGYLMVRQGDKVSLTLGAGAARAHLPPGGTLMHLHRLLRLLEQARPEGPTQLSAILRALFAAAPRRGLLIVLSDLLESPEALFDALARFTWRGWRVLIFHILTEAELVLPGAGPTHYADPEGEGWLVADADALRPAYQAELAAWLKMLETRTRAAGIPYLRLTTTTPYTDALERFLTTRVSLR
jgi:uncharacterized protein (DUF58 family)